MILGDRMEPFDVHKPLIGMVHLLPTPLSPGVEGPWDINDIIDKAIEDGRNLQEGGADGILVENYYDTPFNPEEVPTHTIATMSIVIREVLKEVSVPVGVNILRNACQQAVGIASITGAAFIRCNVLTGMMITNEGIINGKAHEVVRYRNILGKDTKIFADVLVKHAHSLIPIQRFDDVAIDTIDRGGADAIIVTGKRTGLPPSEKLVALTMNLKELRPNARIIVGSGIRPENVIYLEKYFDAFIVGSYFKTYDEVRKQWIIDPKKVRKLKDILHR